MNSKSIEIGGKVFDLTDPEEKKAAIRAWLKVKAAQKTSGEKDASLPEELNPPTGQIKHPTAPES
jgi:hypothetical protein